MGLGVRGEGEGLGLGLEARARARRVRATRLPPFLVERKTGETWVGVGVGVRG